MNTLIQNILAFSTLGLAIAFLITKFIYKPKKSTSKSCGTNDCGCH